MPLDFELDKGRLNALYRALDDLPGKTQRVVLRAALKKGAQVFQKAARQNVYRLLGGVSRFTKSGGLYKKDRTRLGGSIVHDLANSLVLGISRRNRRGEVRMNVVVHRDYNDKFVVMDKEGQRHYIPAAIEYGHAFPGKSATTTNKTLRAAIRRLGKRIFHGGGPQVKPIPYMRKAYIEAGNAALLAIETEAVRRMRLMEIKAEK